MCSKKRVWHLNAYPIYNPLATRQNPRGQRSFTVCTVLHAHEQWLVAPPLVRCVCVLMYCVACLIQFIG